MLQFPQLTRQPKIGNKESASTLDPTLRDPYENGMESSRARFTRMRREYNVAIDLLTPEDKIELEDFRDLEAVAGANIFTFADNRDPNNPQVLTVRFSKIPDFTEAGWHDGSFRYNCSFQLRSV